MSFNDPQNIVWFVIAAVILVYFYIDKNRRRYIRFSSVANLKRLAPSWTLSARHVLIVLRIAAVLLIAIALMRPQKGIKETKIHSEGIDIELVLDVSTSMLAEDFIFKGQRIHRLAIVKNVVKDFIQKRQDDRIGLVVFGGNAYTQCPLTLDYGVLLEFLDNVKVGMIEDGTAIGEGIATALNRLKKVKSKSKVIILLTDGINNSGRISPQEAANLAKAIGVKIYAIGAGSKGKVPYPAKDMFGNTVYQWVRIDLDEETLSQVASLTGGKFYRATDTEDLRKIYDEIDKLERSEIEAKTYHEYYELFYPFVIAAMIILIIENILKHTRFRTIP